MDDPDFIARPLDILIGYTPGMVLPKTRGALSRQWHPKDAFGIRPTEDAHWLWEFRRRNGDRWKYLTRRVQRGITNKKYLARGKRLVRLAVRKGLIDMSDLETKKDTKRVEDALGYCAGLVIDPAADHKHRLSAANTVLSYLKVKPTTKVETTLKTAEDFLDALDD